jgi:hypothetical protein
VYLYKLCGSSQPSIIQGSDGEFYVVKFNGFPGHQSLINEVVGSELILRMGLPAPQWVQIEISSEFIDANPELWFYTQNGRIRPTPGVHFASRLIEASDEQRTYQMIPHSWIERIDNRTDFLGVLILDLWANNCDRRQAIFLSDDHQRLRASFIDNDYMFGGKFGNDTTCPRRAMVYDLSVYKGLWNWEIVQEWCHKIDGIGEDAIRSIVANVPEDWADEHIRLHILSQLSARRVMLPCFLNEVRDVLGSGYSVKYNKARNATEPSPLRNAPILPAPR